MIIDEIFIVPVEQSKNKAYWLLEFLRTTEPAKIKSLAFHTSEKTCAQNDWIRRYPAIICKVPMTIIDNSQWSSMRYSYSQFEQSKNKTWWLSDFLRTTEPAKMKSLAYHTSEKTCAQNLSLQPRVEANTGDSAPQLFGSQISQICIFQISVTLWVLNIFSTGFIFWKGLIESSPNPLSDPKNKHKVPVIQTQTDLENFQNPGFCFWRGDTVPVGPEYIRLVLKNNAQQLTKFCILHTGNNYICV